MLGYCTVQGLSYRAVILHVGDYAAGTARDRLHDIEAEGGVDGGLLPCCDLDALEQRVQHLCSILHLPCTAGDSSECSNL